jgi:signal transduction histidine kinase/PAS domain-containing protein/ActR/RegA family two-component response regulator
MKNHKDAPRTLTAKVKWLVDRYVYSDDLPLEARNINIIGVVGISAAAILFILHIFLGSSPGVTAIAAVMVLTIALLTYICNRYKWYHLCSWITVIFMCYLVFPMVFFLFGGVDGSAIAFFVLAVVIIFLLLRGAELLVAVLIQLVLVSACYVIAAVYPESIVPLDFERRVIDAVYTFIVSGMTLGIIAYFQQKLFYNERAKLIDSKDEIEIAREQAELLISFSPTAIAVFDDRHQVIDINSVAIRMLGLSENPDPLKWLQENIETLVAPIDPNGKPMEVFVKRLETAAREGVSQVTNTLMVNERLVTIDALFKRVDVEDSFKILVYLHNVSELVEARLKVQHHDQLLGVANEVAALLLSREALDLSATMEKVMAMVTQAYEVDRMYVWRDIARGDTVLSLQVYEWPPEGQLAYRSVKSQTHSDVYAWSPRWYYALSAGKVINGPISKEEIGGDMYLERLDIQSIVVVPVFLDWELWGYISLDDCHRERSFSEDEVNILRSVALMLANAIERTQNEALLTDALKKAVSASKAKGDFLSHMSHEIRTPMNAIIGMTSIGKAAATIERKDYAFAKIGDASNHLLGVINDILDISKIEANKLELASADFNFVEMLNNVVNVMSFKIEESAQVFQVDIDPQIPVHLIGDDQHLAQVITNLLSNANKFTASGGTICLEAEYLGEENGIVTLRMCVTDSGIGISAEQQETLFNSFQQAESDTSRKYGGTGLGLAISKRIVEMMDGRIWIESEPGKGASFIFTVKLRVDEDGATRETLGTKERSGGGPSTILDTALGVGPVIVGEGSQSSARASGLTKSQLDTQGETVEDLSAFTVLLVEDVEINQEIVLVLLEPSGINIDIANDGREALSKFEASPERYDAIFMDVQMPVMDGLEATQRIRALDLPRAKEVPIIAMTANVFREDIDRCLEAGMNAHVGKPINLSEVLARLQEYLQA